MKNLQTHFFKRLDRQGVRRILTASLLVLLLNLTSALALAKGGGDIGGGTAAFCPNESRSDKIVRMLDLIEAPKEKLVVPEISGDVKVLVQAALERLAFAFLDQDEDHPGPLQFFASLSDPRNPKVLWTNPRELIKNAPFDLGTSKPVILNYDCNLLLVGYRSGRGEMTIVRRLYEAMTPLHKAAFWVHEAIYAYRNRIFDSSVSEEIGTTEIRYLTAALFAQNVTLPDLIEASQFLANGTKRVFIDATARTSRPYFSGSDLKEIYLQDLPEYMVLKQKAQYPFRAKRQ